VTYIKLNPTDST